MTPANSVGVFYWNKLSNFVKKGYVLQ